MDNNPSIYSIINELQQFQKWDINSYSHEQWTTRSEGDSICDFIISTLEYIEDLEERLEKAENKIQELQEKVE